MKAESSAYLARAEALRDRAAALPEAGLVEDAERAAYLAGFHAAQALIFERLARTPKTHGGVKATFAGLVRNNPHVDAMARGFLGHVYNLKTLVDYDAAWLRQKNGRGWQTRWWQRIGSWPRCRRRCGTRRELRGKPRASRLGCGFAAYPSPSGEHAAEAARASTTMRRAATPAPAISPAKCWATAPLSTA